MGHFNAAHFNAAHFNVTEDIVVGAEDPGVLGTAPADTDIKTTGTLPYTGTGARPRILGTLPA